MTMGPAPRIMIDLMSVRFLMAPPVVQASKGAATAGMAEDDEGGKFIVTFIFLGGGDDERRLVLGCWLPLPALSPLDAEAMPVFTETFATLERDARAWLADVGEPGAVGAIQISADMRYRGQSYEIEVPLERIDVDTIAAAFHARHRAVFDHADEAAPIEVVNLRLAIRAGHDLAGPAVVAQDDTTFLLPAGAHATVLPQGHLMVKL